MCPQIRLWEGWESKRKWQRRRGRNGWGGSSSYSFPLPELKMDSWRNASMAVSRDCDCSPPSNTWDSFALVGHSDGATNTRPPQEGKRRGGREGLEWVGGRVCHYYNASVPKVEECITSIYNDQTSFATLSQSTTQSSLVIQTVPGCDVSWIWSTLNLKLKSSD